MTFVVIGIVVVVVVAAVMAGLMLRDRTSSDGVDSFRRQIDALSPEARRPTVDQVKNVERPSDPGAASGPASGADGAAGGGTDSGPEGSSDRAPGSAGDEGS